MTEAFGGSIDQCCEVLKLDFSSAELAQMAAERGFSQAALDHIGDLFEYLKSKKEQTTIQTILRMSRLPQKAPKTFENFDFSVLRGKAHVDLEKLECSPQFVSDMERGVVGISLATLKNLCLTLGVSSDAILFGTESETSLDALADRCRVLSKEQFAILVEIAEKYIEGVTL